MDNRNMASDITIPEDWHPVDDWSSHRPILWLALKNIPKTAIYEFGIGYGSTPCLKKFIKDREYIEYTSFENNIEWLNAFIEGYKDFCGLKTIYLDRGHWIIKVADYEKCDLQDTNSIVFIDSAPGEQRRSLIEKFKECNALIVHDTEPGAEYVYGMSEVLSQFKYRCDLVIEGMPQTTAVSNVFDFTEWKGIYCKKFHFI